MHAYIISATDKDLIGQKLIKLLKLNLSVDKFFEHPDIIAIEAEDSVKISQVRQLQQRLSRKPLFLPKQFGIILQAQTMTIPAQNAFLKLLEEPSRDTILCLALKNPYKLLPTILSRCQMVKIQESGIRNQESGIRSQTLDILAKLLESGTGGRLAQIEPYAKNRETALDFCREIIDLLENSLHDQNSSLRPLKIGEILKKTLELQTSLEANLNVKLSLDRWALSL